MSTYLVAFVIGEYDYIETSDSNGVSMKVYTPVGKKEHGQFALDVRIRKKTVINRLNIVQNLCRLLPKFYLSMPNISILNIQLLKLIKLLFQISLWGKR